MSYITRTTGTAFTSQQKFTASMWVKGDTPPPADSYWWSIGSAGAHITIYAASNGRINVIGAGPSSAWYQYSKINLRDPAAWYHVVISVDTTQSVANDRIKLYVNGILYADDASWASRSYPSEDDALTGLVSGKIQYIGNNYHISNPWLGNMSHVHYCDGYNYAASDFGEFDATSGIWKMKTSPSVTYGNNGYFLKMEDRTNLDLDSGTNAFTFSTTGTLTPTYDNPSNNFCTWNPLDNYRQGATFAYGNTQFTTTTTAESWNTGTLGVASGKWYWEIQGDIFGIAGLMTDGNTGTYYLGNKVDTWGYYVDGNLWHNGSSTSSWGATHNTTDIMSVAVDLDNNFLYLGKNNVWQNSGVPTSGATGTGGLVVGAPSSGFYYPANGDYGGSAVICTGNFGNGYFGTTAVTSAEADDAGIGAFEYAPPTGFYALCTKNIKAYGG